MDTARKYENLLTKIINKIELNIGGLFSKFGSKLSWLANLINISHDDFVDSLNTNFNTKLNENVKSLYSGVNSSIVQGINDGWDLSNQKNDSLLKELPITINTRQKNDFYDKKESALNAFIEREINGFSLSENVWNKSEETVRNIKNAIKIGIKNGIGEEELAQYLTDYLKNPSETIRQADVKGVINEIKTEYRQGLYSNPLDNAIRLARTEINMAYKTADQERWKKLDFVVGYEVHLSKLHKSLQNGSVMKIKDICDILAGSYPKDFRFVGWHPNCRCYITPIIDVENKDRQEKVAKETKKIVDVPDNFKSWVADNEERIEKSKNKPFFITDNISIYNAIREEPHKLTLSEIETINSIFDSKITMQEYNNSTIKGADILQLDNELTIGAQKIGITFNSRKLTFEDNMVTIEYEAPNGLCSISRKIFTENGEIKAEHTFFELSDAQDSNGEYLYQGKGYSKTVMSAFYKQYKKIGVSEIEIGANLEIGGWCWAKYGFCLYNKSAIMNWLSKTERYARIKGVYEEMEDIINNFYKSPNTIDTPFPMNLLAKEKYKDILVVHLGVVSF